MGAARGDRLAVPSRQSKVASGHTTRATTANSGHHRWTYKSVTIGSTLTLLVVLLLPHAANATSARGLEPPSVTAPASETPWFEAKRPERIDRMHMPPPAQAVLEIYHVAFSPKWVKLDVGVSIGIYVAFSNTGPPGTITSEFRIYLSRDGRVLEKRRSSLTGGLRAGRSSSTTFQITLPNKPGRYCWEVSLRQTDDGRMTLGDPKVLCAFLKTKPIPGLPKRRP